VTVLLKSKSELEIDEFPSGKLGVRTLEGTRVERGRHADEMERS
jgi:hypothetical protein